MIQNSFFCICRASAYSLTDPIRSHIYFTPKCLWHCQVLRCMEFNSPECRQLFGSAMELNMQRCIVSSLMIWPLFASQRALQCAYRTSLAMHLERRHNRFYFWIEFQIRLRYKRHILCHTCSIDIWVGKRQHWMQMQKVQSIESAKLMHLTESCYFHLTSSLIANSNVVQ